LRVLVIFATTSHRRSVIYIYPLDQLYLLFSFIFVVSAESFVSAVSARFGSEKKKSKPRPSDTAVAGTNSARCSPLPPPLVGLAGPSVPTSPTTDCSSASPRPQAASPIFDFNTKLWRKVCFVFSFFKFFFMFIETYYTVFGDP
jgi:hypothetical protein